MKFLNADIDFDAFFHRVAQSRDGILMLDYDGTLAPFCERRGEAAPYPGVRERLDALIGDGRCRLVIVSGRSLEDLIPLLGLARLPEIWGSHGFERMLADGTTSGLKLPEGAADGLEEAVAWAEQQGLGERLERKPASLALHWRGAGEGEAQDLRERARAGWGGIALDCGLRLDDFDGGIEIRAPGRDKGDAVRTILGESNGEPAAAYLGDDLTDEDAFMALKGKGLSVLVGERLRDTAADVWLKPPEEMLEFLDRWIAASGGTDER